MYNTFQKSIFSVILAFFSVASATTYAQTVRPSASVSIQAGLSLATVSPEEDEDDVYIYSYRSGVNVRASIFLPFSDLIGTQLGLGYVQKGASLSVDEDDPDYDYYGSGFDLSAELKTAYLQVPILLAVHPIPILRLLAGPVVSFPLNCSIEAFGITGDCGEDGSDLKTDLSIMAGAGVHIPLFSTFSLSLDAVYDLGLTTIFEDEDSDSKNRGFLFAAGISVPLRR